MALLQSDLDALDRAIAQGVLSVQYSDRSVVYRNLADMITTRNFIATEIAGSEGKTSRPRAWFVYSTKGF